MRRANVEMTQGSIVKNMLLFALPLALSSILQTMYNMADMAVVGQSADGGTAAVAAIGATGVITSIFINIFAGISVGANVLVAFFIGARDKKNASDTVQTALWGSLFLGLLLCGAGFLTAEPFLVLTECPADVYADALLYLRVYFAGVPFATVYNFGASVLRARGDSTRPLFFLGISGLLNVVLNLIAVLGLGWGVAGVSAATSAANLASAVMVAVTLIRDKNEYTKFDPRRFFIDFRKILRILGVGVPVALSSLLYCISNLQIQSAVNSFGSATMAGNSAAGNLEGYTAAFNGAFGSAVLSFASQNRGAGNLGRVKKSVLWGCVLGGAVSGGLGVCLWLLRYPLLGLILGSGLEGDPSYLSTALEVGAMRASFLLLAYAMPPISNALGSGMRGLGYSLTPTLVSVFGVCGWRAFWMFAIYPLDPTMFNIYLCYTISWSLVMVFSFFFWLFTYRRYAKKHPPAAA